MDYTLTDPFLIGPRLMPAVRLSDGSVVSMEAVARDPRGGERFTWRYTIDDASGVELVDAADINGPTDHAEAFATLSSFLGAFAEAGEDGENADLFPESVRDWADANAEEFDSIVREPEGRYEWVGGLEVYVEVGETIEEATARTIGGAPTSPTPHANGWACSDCLVLLANGETPPDMDEEATAQYVAMTFEVNVSLGRMFGEDGCEHTSEQWHADSSVQEEHAYQCERLEFSWSRCDVCRRPSMAGERHAVTIWLKEGAGVSS